MALLMQVRIVCIDYYLAPPLAQVDVCYSSFGGTAIDRVPVVRVFGSTPAGQKACVHLHKVWSGKLLVSGRHTCTKVDRITALSLQFPHSAKPSALKVQIQGHTSLCCYNTIDGLPAT